MNGDIFPVKDAFGQYMGRFYGGLYASTKALQEYVLRGLNRSIIWAPGRMVDSVDEMLASYQKNDNGTASHPAQPGKGALFPVIIVGMAKDYTASGPDQQSRQAGRRLVRITDAPDASVYGYRQAAGDVRVQVVIMAAESATAQSLAAQFCLFVGEVPNRRFRAKHVWNGYELEMPCLLENPDIIFAEVKNDNRNMTILAADLTLKAQIPYLDAPKLGEDNDGSSNNPPGYPVVVQVHTINRVTLVEHLIEPDPAP